MKCERCFHLQYKHKISLPSFPFTLNLAVDHLCKNEFDSYRAKGEPHPIFIEHGIDANRIKIVGRGDQSLIAKIEDKDQAELNRRVDFTIIK